MDSASRHTRAHSRQRPPGTKFASRACGQCRLRKTQSAARCTDLVLMRIFSYSTIDISERPTSSSRADQAKVLVHEATRMRSSSADFGESPSIEAVLTSFFLFGYLFGSGQHNAAKLRLREALGLASTLGLDNPASYADCSSPEFKGQWLRTYLVLSVTERAYALQRQHPLTFTGCRPHEITRSASEEIRNCTTQRLDIPGIIVHTEKEAAGMLGLSLLMEIFDAIDEAILIYWNGRCPVSIDNGKCQILTKPKVYHTYLDFGGFTISTPSARVGDIMHSLKARNERRASYLII
ncbi:hypothetical protein BDV11DRAFT_174005 [Aspergillus similis]